MSLEQTVLSGAVLAAMLWVGSEVRALRVDVTRLVEQLSGESGVVARVRRLEAHLYRRADDYPIQEA